jgi:hypothetical protein
MKLLDVSHHSHGREFHDGRLREPKPHEVGVQNITWYSFPSAAGRRCVIALGQIGHTGLLRNASSAILAFSAASIFRLVLFVIIRSV